jgi:hypothetical protein
VVDIAKGTARLQKESELLQGEIRAMKDSDYPPDLKKMKLNVSTVLSKQDFEANPHVMDILHR